jgi:RNA polymerase sigma-70 factor (ECF subfamily)
MIPIIPTPVRNYPRRDMPVEPGGGELLLGPSAENDAGQAETIIEKPQTLKRQRMEEISVPTRPMGDDVEQSAVMEKGEIDGEVIEACKRGDRDAFHALFEMYKDRVFSIALHYCGNDSTAGDICQQVFVKLFTRIGQFRQESGFTTWLYRIVANTCFDEQRSRRRFVPMDPDGEVTRIPVQPSQERNLIRRQVAESVQAAIADLKPKLRMPMLLKYVEGLSYEEIAASLGISMGTVASRLNRGHKMLAVKLAHLRTEVSEGE